MSGISRINSFLKRLALQGFAFWIVLCTGEYAFSRSSVPPTETIRAFVFLLNQGEYRKAYAYFSKPLQEEITYGEFHAGARRIQSVKIMTTALLTSDSHLAKVNLTLTGLLREKEEKSWRKKTYTGEVVLVLEKGGWRLIQVNLMRPKKPAKTRQLK